MKISIAMATYNGARYITEQLESFVSQTHQPDELVVCDDGSTDNTVDLVKDFARTAKFEIKIFLNERRLGYGNNFAKAIDLCTGDLIFLSDQDDVWLPDKVAHVARLFSANPSTIVVVNDCAFTDAALRPTGRTHTQQAQVAGFGIGSLVPGCCMTIRAKFKSLITPIPESESAHDLWITKLVTTLSAQTYLAEILQYYRRHETNVSNTSKLAVALSGGGGSRWRMAVNQLARHDPRIDPADACESRLKELQMLKSRFESCSSCFESQASADLLTAALARIDAECIGNSARKEFLKESFWKRVYSATKFYRSGGYQQFAGWKSLIKDIIL